MAERVSNRLLMLEYTHRHFQHNNTGNKGLSSPNSMSCMAQTWPLSIESFLSLCCLKSMEEWLEDLTCLPGPERCWRLRKTLWWSSVSLILWRASFCQTPCCLRESKLAHMERTPSDIYVPSFIIVTDLLAMCNGFF